MRKKALCCIVFALILLVLALSVYGQESTGFNKVLPKIYGRQSMDPNVPKDMQELQKAVSEPSSDWVGMRPILPDDNIQAWADNALDNLPPRDMDANELRGFSYIASRLGSEYLMFNQVADLFNVNEEELCIIPTDNAGAALVSAEGITLQSPPPTAAAGQRPSGGGVLEGMPQISLGGGAGMGDSGIDVFGALASAEQNKEYLGQISKWMNGGTVKMSDLYGGEYITDPNDDSKRIKNPAWENAKAAGVEEKEFKGNLYQSVSSTLQGMQGLGQREGVSWVEDQFKELSAAWDQAHDVFGWAVSSHSNVVEIQGILGNAVFSGIEGVGGWNYLKEGLSRGADAQRYETLSNIYDLLEEQILKEEDEQEEGWEERRDQLQKQLDQVKPLFEQASEEVGWLAQGIESISSIVSELHNVMKFEQEDEEFFTSEGGAIISTRAALEQAIERANQKMASFRSGAPEFWNQMNNLAAQNGFASGKDYMWYKAINTFNTELNGVINGGFSEATGKNYGIGITEGMNFLNSFVNSVGGVLANAMGSMSQEEAQEANNQFKDLQERTKDLEERANEIKEDNKDLQDDTKDATEDGKLSNSEISGLIQKQFELSSKTESFLHDFAKVLKELMTLTGKSLQELIDEVWDDLSKEPDWQTDPETGEKVNKGGIGETPTSPCSIFPDPPCGDCPVGIYGKKETLEAGGMTPAEAEAQISNEEIAEATTQGAVGAAVGAAAGAASAAGAAGAAAGAAMGAITGSIVGSAIGSTVGAVTGSVVAGIIPGEEPGDGDGEPGVEEGPPQPEGPTTASAECIERKRCPDFVKPPEKEEEEEEGEEEGEEEPAAGGAPAEREGEAGAEVGKKGEGAGVPPRSAATQNPAGNSARQRLESRTEATEEHDELAKKNGLVKDEEALEGKIMYDGKEVRVLKVGSEDEGYNIVLLIPGYEDRPIAFKYDAKLWEYIRNNPAWIKKYIKKWFEDAGLDPSKLSFENGETVYVDPETGERYEPVKGGIAKIGTQDQRDEALSNVQQEAEELKKLLSDVEGNVQRLKELSQKREEARQEINRKIEEYRQQLAELNKKIKEAREVIEMYEKLLDITRRMAEAGEEDVTQEDYLKMFNEEYLPARQKLTELMKELEGFKQAGMDGLKREFAETFAALDNEYQALKDQLSGKKFSDAQEEYSSLVDFKFDKFAANTNAQKEYEARAAALEAVVKHAQSANSQVECP